MSRNVSLPARGMRKRRMPDAPRRPSRHTISARIRVLRALLDEAHGRIRALEQALARLIARF